MGDDSDYEMFSNPKLMYGTMGAVLISIVGLSVSSKLLEPERVETTPKQALVRRCLGKDDGTPKYKVDVDVFLDDFAEVNGWKYNPDSDRFYDGPNVVKQKMVRQASRNYDCAVRRVQNR